MGMFDNLKGKAEDLVNSHGDKVGEGLDKVGDLIDQKTGGQHSEKIAQGVEQAKQRLDALDGQDDDIDNGPAQPDRPI